MGQFVGGWVSEWVHVSITLYLVDMIATTVFAQSLSNFTCKLWMMREGSRLILGHGVKGQGQLWHSVYKTLWAGYRLQFLPSHFQTSHVSCGWWEVRGRTLLILGHGVKGQGQLWHSVCKALWAQYRLQINFSHFQTSHESCGWWGEEPY